MKLSTKLLLLALLIDTISLCGWAQISGPPAAPSASTNDDTGFELIFNGKTLKGWDGDQKYWRVENGSLVGEVTADTVQKRNSFIIWRGGMTRDFELKVEYRVSAHGNSGVNYRSVEVPDEQWALRGYQADIAGEDRNTNDVRTLARIMKSVCAHFLLCAARWSGSTQARNSLTIASLGDMKQLKSFIRNEDWNECHLMLAAIS